MHAHACTCMHMHTNAHAYIHSFIHTYIHTCIHTYIHTYVRMYIYVCILHTYVYYIRMGDPWVPSHTKQNFNRT